MKHVSISMALFVVGAGLTLMTAKAQSTATPYAGEQVRSIKSLSERDVTALLQGQGAGLAKAAELNGYPGPMHTLELKDKLQLSAEQATASQSLMTSHKARARELGAQVLEAERKLDAVFANRSADKAAVEQATQQVGLLQARLRAEHLNTHLQQTALLSSQQIKRYNELRGYTTNSTTNANASDKPSGHGEHSSPHQHQ
jgi:Spy/CpxP family protein refolding chaperone